MIYITFQFFSFLDAILGTDSVSGGSSCIQAIFTLTESVRLGDQSMWKLTKREESKMTAAMMSEVW